MSGGKAVILARFYLDAARQRLRTRLSLATGLIAGWVLTMISLPIQGWLWGESAIIRGASVGVVLQAVAVGALMGQAWSRGRAMRLAAGVCLFAWAVEWIGVKTGAPFGSYYYTARLQPQVGGVPVIVPLAWLMMIPPSWAVAASILGDRRGWAFAFLSGLAFAAWDLFLDPQMVRWGLWIWSGSSGYYGIPWTNFVGWIAMAAVLTLLLRPERVTSSGLVSVYILTWLLESVALWFFWGLPGPAAVGFVGMGMFVSLAFIGRRGSR